MRKNPNYYKEEVAYSIYLLNLLVHGKYDFFTRDRVDEFIKKHKEVVNKYPVVLCGSKIVEVFDS